MNWRKYRKDEPSKKRIERIKPPGQRSSTPFIRFFGSQETQESFPPGISIQDVQREAGAEWEKVKGSLEWLRILAEAIYCRRLREMGQAPPTYTAQRYCENCGPVMLESWNPGTVKGCPWCLVSGERNPIPKAK